MTGAGSDRSARRAPGALAARVFDRIIAAGGALAAGLLVVIMLATTVKVVYRYGLHQSLIGVDQISGTLLLYVAFLGAAWVLRRDEHVTIDLLLGQLTPRARRILLLGAALLGAAVCFVVAVFGTLEVVTSLQRGIRIPAEIEMPRAVNLVVIPIGFLLLGFQFLRRALHLRRHDAPPPPVISV